MTRSKAGATDPRKRLGELRFLLFVALLVLSGCDSRTPEGDGGQSMIDSGSMSTWLVGKWAAVDTPALRIGDVQNLDIEFFQDGTMAALDRSYFFGRFSYAGDYRSLNDSTIRTDFTAMSTGFFVGSTVLVATFRDGVLTLTQPNGRSHRYRRVGDRRGEAASLEASVVSGDHSSPEAVIDRLYGELQRYNPEGVYALMDPYNPETRRASLRKEFSSSLSELEEQGLRIEYRIEEVEMLSVSDNVATVTITLTVGTVQDRVSVQVVKRDGKWYIRQF